MTEYVLEMEDYSLDFPHVEEIMKSAYLPSFQQK